MMCCSVIFVNAIITIKHDFSVALTSAGPLRYMTGERG